ncbi:hypothetical protein BST61_g11459 [Cercospora zeina]
MTPQNHLSGTAREQQKAQLRAERAHVKQGLHQLKAEVEAQRAKVANHPSAPSRRLMPGSFMLSATESDVLSATEGPNATSEAGDSDATEVPDDYQQEEAEAAEPDALPSMFAKLQEIGLALTNQDLAEPERTTTALRHCVQLLALLEASVDRQVRYLGSVASQRAMELAQARLAMQMAGMELPDENGGIEGLYSDSAADASGDEADVDDDDSEGDWQDQ